MINEAGCAVYKFADVRTSGTALDKTAAGKRLDPEEQEVRGLKGQNFGAETLLWGWWMN